MPCTCPGSVADTGILFAVPHRLHAGCLWNMHVTVEHLQRMISVTTRHHHCCMVVQPIYFLYSTLYVLKMTLCIACGMCNGRTACAGDVKSTDNLLELSIEAARCRCTVGEISDALEKKWGRANIVSSTVTGAYAAEYGEDDEIRAAIDAIHRFEDKAGRRPRMMVAKVGWKYSYRKGFPKIRGFVFVAFKIIQRK